MADAVNDVRQHSNADGKAPVNTRYHSGFVSGLELLLWQYREKIDIREEEWLSTGGIRMDVLVLKKDPAVDLDFDICRIFRGHNILEYKRADDKLNIDVIAKVMAYANLYKSRGVPVNAIPYSEISATIYRHAYPREAFRLLKYHGAVIEEKFPGVYYVSGMGAFSVQILVGRQLDPREYAMFRVLRKGATDDEIRQFKDMAVRNKDASYLKSVDGVYQVSVSANRESYDRLMKEDPEMCEALRDLMKEEFEMTEARGQARGEAIGEARGEARGEVKGAIKLYRDEMHLMPAEITQKIMARFDLRLDEAEKYVEETLGMQLA